MFVFHFRSTIDPKMLAFTRDPAGEALPPELAPWQPLGRLEALPGGSIDGVASADDILAAIAATGVYVADLGPKPENVPA